MELFRQSPISTTKRRIYQKLFRPFNICLTISVGLIFAHHLVGIGIGTVLAVIGVGRAIAAFNHFFKQPMAVLSGMNES